MQATGKQSYIILNNLFHDNVIFQRTKIVKDFSAKNQTLFFGRPKLFMISDLRSTIDYLFTISLISRGT